AKKVTAAAATALAAATSLAMPAHANVTPKTFPGLNGKLTISTGDNQLHFASATGNSAMPMPSPQVSGAEWSPNGSRVAYVDQNGSLISARYDGSDAIPVASGLSSDSHPTWMNGGSFLVYAQGGNLYKVPRLGRAAPVVLSAGHQSGDQDSNPQGGADGVLVFQRVDGQSKNSEIVVYNGYTDTQNLIANSGGGTFPALSPDAKTVVFSKPDGQVPRPGIQLWTVNTDGSNLRQLTSDQGGNVRNDRATWSPDGIVIAYDAEGSGELMTTAPKPGAAKNPHGQLQGAVRLSWQADGDTGAAPSPANPVNLVERPAGPERIGTADEVSG